MNTRKKLNYLHLQDIKNNYIVLLICILVIACKGDGFKSYYDQNGMLISKEKLVNATDSTYYSIIYNDKGRVVREGYSDNNGIGNGYWKTYFDDGALKWEGIAKDGVPFVDDSILDNIEKQYSYLIFEGKPKYLKLNREYNIRTYVQGVPFSHYIVTDSMFNELEINDKDFENYHYKITPRKIGDLDIWIIFPDSNGNVIPNVTKAKLFSIKVVE